MREPALCSLEEPGKAEGWEGGSCLEENGGTCYGGHQASCRPLHHVLQAGSPMWLLLELHPVWTMGFDATWT